jgi:hypothetical protein
VPGSWWRTVLLALLLVVSTEIGARALLGTELLPDDYWDAETGQKFEWYRRLDADHAIDILIIGDSTAARNFAPLAIEEQLNGATAFNLGSPGNFPLALRESTFPLLRRGPVPRVVVLSQFVDSYYPSAAADDLERGILTSRAVRVLNDRRVASDHLAIAQLYRNRRVIRERLAGEKWIDAPELKGFMPDRRTAEEVAARETRREAARTGRVRETAVPARLRTVDELAAMARERGFTLVVLIPDQRDARSEAILADHRRWLRARSGELGFEVLDMAEAIALEPGDFIDTVHLSPTGAVNQSRALGRLLAPRLETLHPETDLN